MKKILAEYGSRGVIITITTIFCALLEIIDSTIVNVALNNMKGSVGATYRMLDNSLTKQSTLLSYIDVFLIVGIMFLVCVPFILLFIRAGNQKININEAIH